MSYEDVITTRNEEIFYRSNKKLHTVGIVDENQIYDLTAKAIKYFFHFCEEKGADYFDSPDHMINFIIMKSVSLAKDEMRKNREFTVFLVSDADGNQMTVDETLDYLYQESNTISLWHFHNEDRDPAEQCEEKFIVEEILNMMSEVQKEAWNYNLAGYTAQQVADEIGIPIYTYYKRLQRGITEARKQMKLGRKKSST